MRRAFIKNLSSVLILTVSFSLPAFASKPLIRQIAPFERILSDKISISQKIDGDRSVVTFTSKVPLELESYMMPQIQRYVVDITNLTDNAEAEVSITGKMPVRRVIRQSKEINGARISRVILDLSGEYSVKPLLEKEGRELSLFISPVKKSADPSKQAVISGKRAEKLKPVVPVKTSSLFKAIVSVEIQPGGLFFGTEGEPDIIRHFRLKQPERIVIDLPPARVAVKEETIVRKSGVNRVRVKNDGTRTRVVLDLLSEAAAGYGVSVKADGFLVETGDFR